MQCKQTNCLAKRLYSKKSINPKQTYETRIQPHCPSLKIPSNQKPPVPVSPPTIPHSHLAIYNISSPQPYSIEKSSKLSSSSCKPQATIAVSHQSHRCPYQILLLTGLIELFANVAMQAASAIGFSPASASAAAQDTTVGARAAMHSVGCGQLYLR
jgi:hypothetical protein